METVGITLLIIASIYSLTFIEAILWHLEGYKIGTINKHIPLVIVRISVCLLGLLISYNYTIGMGLIVVGIHPSILYYYRNRFNPSIYIKGIFSNPSVGKKTSKINFKLWHRIVLTVFGIIVLSIGAMAQDTITDFSKLNRSQLRQYRLLVETTHKKELQKERAYYSYMITNSKLVIKELKKYNEFKIDSMQEYRRLERLNFNKIIKQIRLENNAIKDSLKISTNYNIKQNKILLKIKRNNTRYLYGIIILIAISIILIIYLSNKANKWKKAITT